MPLVQQYAGKLGVTPAAAPGAWGMPATLAGKRRSAALRASTAALGLVGPRAVASAGYAALGPLSYCIYWKFQNLAIGRGNCQQWCKQKGKGEIIVTKLTAVEEKLQGISKMLSQHTTDHQVIVSGKEKIHTESISILSTLINILEPYVKISHERYPVNGAKGIRLQKLLWLLENGKLAYYKTAAPWQMDITLLRAVEMYSVEKIIDYVYDHLLKLIDDNKRTISINEKELEHVKSIANLLKK